MDKIIAIGNVTFKEALRNKILYTIFFFALAMIGSSTVLESLFIGEHGKIIKDVGLNAIELLGLLVALFVGIGLIQVELEKKTIYFVLSKPVKRAEFILGKYLGLAMTLLALTVSMAAIFILVALLYRLEISGMLLAAIAFIYLKLLLVAALMLMFNSFAGPIMSGIFTISLYAIGHMAADIRDTGALLGNPFLEKMLEIFYLVIPNMNNFNFKTSAIYNITESSHTISFAGAYWLLFTAAILALTGVIFQRREFK